MKNHDMKPFAEVWICIFAVILLLALFFTIAPANAQDELPRVSPLPPIVNLEQTPPATDTASVPPLSDVGQLLTPEVILALVFLLTMPLTTLTKRLFGLSGTTANALTNVALNAVAKGITLFATGQATWQFALAMFFLGVTLDKTIYDLITRGKQEKINELVEDADFGDGESVSRQP